jgi:hypothetical protein
VPTNAISDCFKLDLSVRSWQANAIDGGSMKAKIEIRNSNSFI